MNRVELNSKITASHLARKAVVYLRQSSLAQVKYNTESQRLQYALKDTAMAYGFARVEVIDCDCCLAVYLTFHRQFYCGVYHREVG